MLNSGGFSNGSINELFYHFLEFITHVYFYEENFETYLSSEIIMYFNSIPLMLKDEEK